MSLHRRPGRFVPFVLVLGLALGWTAPAMAAPPEVADVIIVLHDGVDARSTARDMERSHDARIAHVYEYALRGFAAEVPVGRLEGLRRDPRVDYIDENRVVHAVAESYPNGVKRIDGDDAHTTTATVNGTGAEVRVAVIDTGIQLGHLDLDGNIDAHLAKDCINAGGNANDDQGHGTHVAGTIAAEDNDRDVVGVAPAARLVPVKVLDSSGSGTWAQVICGIDWVTYLNTDTEADGALKTTNDVDVANMSLGGAGSHDGTKCADHAASKTLPSTSMFDALCKAMATGTTFTVAAGNDGKDASGFVPAAYPDVITVSAYSDTDGQYNASTSCSGRGPWKTCDEALASFSNYGTIVDVTAPGVNIVSTTYDGATGTKSGTSMAAPHVAGVAALVIANAGSTVLMPADVATRLKDTGQCPDGTVNPGIETCAGAWNSDPDGVAEPMVNALWAATGNTGSTTTNTAPVAVDDSYASTTGVQLVVGSPGVLGNDTDDGGAASLSATIVSNASNGLVTLASDGSFTYLSSEDFTGTDSFTYKAVDGATLESAVATVEISVSGSTTGSTDSFVTDLDGSATNQGSTWMPSATVHVSPAVAGATVSGYWGTGSTVGCTTDANGSCTIPGPSVKKSTSTVTFSVTGVTLEGYTYKASRNSDPDGDSDGTTITVAKP